LAQSGRGRGEAFAFALTAVRVYRADNDSETLDIGAFAIDAASGAVLVPAGVKAPGRESSGIELDVEVGYGDTPDHVPEPLCHAIRMLVAHWYENRASGDRAMPSSVAVLLSPYRTLSL
jgi:uncharacterized phiE125 gp8 family phage protein